MSQLQRDKKGRFLPGVPGSSPGRPRRAVEEKYHEILVGKVSEADWQAIIERAVTEAKAGDRDARNFLANYLLGKPRESLDLTSADLPIAINVGYVPARGETQSSSDQDEENAT